MRRPALGIFETVRPRRGGTAASLDRLRAISSAYTAFQNRLELTSSGAAGIVFHPLGDSEARALVERAKTTLGPTRNGSHTTLEPSDDPYDFRWLVLRCGNFEALVAAIYAISADLQASGWWRAMLCAVFSFEHARWSPVYWVYNYKRGFFYPLAPGASNGDQRGRLSELRQGGAELPTEPDTARWFPLWRIRV